jgi:PST family polysaccharide transporter
VALAGFSRLVTDPVALSRSFARGLALLMAATVPVCALLSSYADALLGFVYGEPWVAAAQALVLLAPLGLIRVALFVVYDLFVALGRSRVLIGLQALWLVAMIPALTVGTRVAGIRGAALAHLLVAALLVAPAFFLAVARQGVAIGPALRACLRPLLGGVLIVLSALVVREVVGGNLPRLLVGGAVGMVLYLGVTWPMRALLPGRAPATPAPGEGTGDALPVGMSGAVHPVPVSAAPAVAGASRDEAR